MIINIGNYVDPNTSEVKERKLIFGRLIKDGEMKTVGAKGRQMLTLTCSPGRDEPLVSIKLWGYDAADNDGIKKGTMILADAVKEEREYMGKTYTDYVPINFSALGDEKPAQKRARMPRNTNEVVPENPNAGFTDIASSDLPWETGEF